jgi:hypothetical protein
MLESKRYECCHESGHAVARRVIGDTLLEIRVDANAVNAIGERGSTDSRAGEYECTCGYIRNRSADEFDAQSCVSLNPNCPECMQRLKNRRGCAGGAYERNSRKSPCNGNNLPHHFRILVKSVLCGAMKV